MSKNNRQQRDQLDQEARRLAELTVRERKAALDVHRSIAGDPRLSRATRDYARQVVETLEKLVARILKNRK